MAIAVSALSTPYRHGVEENGSWKLVSPSRREWIWISLPSHFDAQMRKRRVTAGQSQVAQTKRKIEIARLQDQAGPGWRSGGEEINKSRGRKQARAWHSRVVLLEPRGGSRLCESPTSLPFLCSIASLLLTSSPRDLRSSGSVTASGACGGRSRTAWESHKPPAP